MKLILVTLLCLLAPALGEKRNHGGKHVNGNGDQWTATNPTNQDREAYLVVNMMRVDPATTISMAAGAGWTGLNNGGSFRFPMRQDLNLGEVADVMHSGSALGLTGELQETYYCARGPIIGNCVISTATGGGAANGGQGAANLIQGSYSNLITNDWWLMGISTQASGGYMIVGYIDWEESAPGNNNPIFSGYHFTYNGQTRFVAVYMADVAQTAPYESVVIIDGVKHTMTLTGRAIYIYDHGSLITGCSKYMFSFYWKDYNTNPDLRHEIVYRYPENDVLTAGSGCAGTSGLPNGVCPTNNGGCGAHGVCFDGTCVCATGWAKNASRVGGGKCTVCVGDGTANFCPPVCTAANCTYDKSTPFWDIQCGRAQPDGCGGYNDCADQCVLYGYRDVNNGDLDECDSYDGGLTGRCCLQPGYCQTCARTTCERIKLFYNNVTQDFCKTFTDGCGFTMDCRAQYPELCGVVTPNVTCYYSCAAAGKNCGLQDLNCGTFLDCGTCGTGETCQNGVCYCPPGSTTCCTESCISKGWACGTGTTSTTGNCNGSPLNCGSCPSGQTCVNHACVQSTGTGTGGPVCLSCAQAGKNCGVFTQAGCAPLNCGTCTQNCTGNVCVSYSGCTPATSCNQFSMSCGDLFVGAGCPRQHCGDCAANCYCQGRNGLPAANGGDCVCAGATCVPASCGSRVCGSVSDSCGNAKPCGSPCPSGFVCNSAGTLCLPDVTSVTAIPPPVSPPPSVSTCPNPFACPTTNGGTVATSSNSAPPPPSSTNSGPTNSVSPTTSNPTNSATPPSASGSGPSPSGSGFDGNGSDGSKLVVLTLLLLLQ